MNKAKCQTDTLEGDGLVMKGTTRRSYAGLLPHHTRIASSKCARRFLPTVAENYCCACGGLFAGQMNRSGIFQIAFDHDKDGERSTHHESPEELEDTRWIHEQRLEIEHPDFFCGHGNNPPRGPDNSRPKGAWYLHASTGHIIDAAPAVGATSSSFMDDRMIV